MIDEPIAFSDAALEHIEKYDGVNYKYWNVDCPENSAIRKEIRGYYRSKQQFKCVYCNRLRQDFHGGQWDIDHVVPKQIYPHFLYEERNLVVTCKDCNQKKSNKNVLAENTDASQNYPNQKENYKIIHPHFDNYLDHIDVSYNHSGMIIHKFKTQKGVFTFETCGLIRFSEMLNETSEVNEENQTSLDLTDPLVLELSTNLDRLISELGGANQSVLADILRDKLRMIVNRGQ